jgi:hypothetical protein
MTEQTPTRLVDLHADYIRPKYRNLPHWRQDPDNLYIGRPGVDSINGKNVPREGSIWANPFKVKDGDITTRLTQYQEHIQRVLANGEANLAELRGKRLGCWCVKEGEVVHDPSLPFSRYVCHGQVLMKLLAESDLCVPSSLSKREVKEDISAKDDFPSLASPSPVSTMETTQVTNANKPLSFAQMLKKSSLK